MVQWYLDKAPYDEAGLATERLAAERAQKEFEKASKYLVTLQNRLADHVSDDDDIPTFLDPRT